MSLADLIKDVIACPGVATQAAPGRQQLETCLASCGHALPADHVQLLLHTDGVMAFGGYFRIFGVLTSTCGNLLTWNAPEAWKLAWPNDLAEYVCFGETAWGDQYAYRTDELHGDAEPAVYFLESLTLEPERLSTTFSDFLSTDFLRNCRSPYDELLVRARQKLGDLRADEHITYAPSPLITGEESLEHVVKMPATAAMIVNGDLASQLAGELQSREIKGLQPFQDEHGRSRIKVLWA